MNYIDLHVHSTESDGSMTPEELVQYACEKGLYAFALTDHNTVSGVSRAMAAADKLPVYVIPGIELTSEFEGCEVHILGYKLNYHDTQLLENLNELKKFREDRNRRMADLLTEHGVEVNIDELHEMFPNAQNLTRANFAYYLIRHGYVKDKQEAFDRYLGDHCPCFIPNFRLTLNEAYQMISSAEGIAVIAHPVMYDMDDKMYHRFFTEAFNAGIHGVEAIYSENSFEDEIRFTNMARKHNMFITGGSDFHGSMKPDIDLGTGRGNLMIPRALLKNIGY